MKFYHRWVAAALLVSVLSAPSVALAMPVSGQGTWETTLLGRDLDGNPSTFEAYYDTVLNISWLADANYAGTAMTWSAANAWAASLNINGHTAWRLPTVIDTGTSGCDFAYHGTDCGYNVDTSSGEMAHMFYITLGNLALFDTSGNSPQPGWGRDSVNTGPFSNMQTDAYWSSTVYAPFPDGRAWFFHPVSGLQDQTRQENNFHAWAVLPYDVGTTVVVPIPAAAWLFGSGLLGLIGMAHRNQFREAS